MCTRSRCTMPARLNEAMSVLKTALKANPNDVNVLTGLVYFCQQAGDGAAARRYLAQLRELDPGNPEWDQLQQQLDAPSAN